MTLTVDRTLNQLNQTKPRREKIKIPNLVASYDHAMGAAEQLRSFKDGLPVMQCNYVAVM